MEYLGKEQLKDINFFGNNNDTKKSEEISEEEINNSKTPEKLLKKLEKNVIFSKNEKNLRDKYLKHYTKKEIFQRSIKLGKRNMVIKIIQYVLSIISEVLNFKEANYNAEVIKNLTNKEFGNIMMNVFLYFIVIIIGGIIYEVNSYLDWKLTDVSKENILLENLLKKDMEFYDVFKTGELCDKCNYYGAFPSYDIFKAIFDFIKKIGTLFYSGYYLYNNFLTMGIISIIFFFLKLFINPYINNQVDLSEFEERYNLKNDILNEIFSNIRLIKSFGTEEKELRKLYKVTSKLREDSLKIKILKHMNNYFGLINSMIVFYILINKCKIGEMEYGDLINFNKYIAEFGDSLNYLLNIVSSTMFGILEWKKFLEFYDVKTKIFSKENAIILDNNNEKEGLDIEFKNVDFFYPTSDVQIFQNLNIKIPSGKIVAFVGYSGSGKTTITSLIQRFYDPNKGEIKINGINIKDLDLKCLRKNIGIVSQEPILNSTSIKDNILYGVDSTECSEDLFKSVCDLSHVSDFVENKDLFPLGYDTMCGERGVILSGGQKQRIAIARALIKKSKILIFDEATSALDAETELILQNSIYDIIRKRNVTAIIIAHRLSTIKFVDCIYVLNKGKICEFGSHRQLIENNGVYKQLIQNQIDN